MSNLWVLPEELGDYATSEYAYEAAQTASFLLWGLSGRKWSGITTVTERYTTTQDGISLRDYRITPALAYSRLPEVATRIRLRGQPIISVDKITYAITDHVSDVIGGTVGDTLDTSRYLITDHSTVNFFDLINQDVDITYTYGTRPPVAGRMAARQLAIEFARLWSGDDECALPDRVTSVSRQGVNFTILDNQDFIAELRTGIYAVDLFLKTVNPDKARARARVFSPDIPRARRIR